LARKSSSAALVAVAFVLQPVVVFGQAGVEVFDAAQQPELFGAVRVGAQTAAGGEQFHGVDFGGARRDDQSQQ